MKAIIMTRSAMYGANCVAAIDMETGCFKRFVKRVGDTIFQLSDMELYCKSKSLSCDPLDLVEVDVVEPCPSAHQTENMIIDTTKGFKRICELPIEEVLRIHMPENEREYILGSKNRALSMEEARQIGHSLELMEVNALVVARSSGSLKADFVYKGSRHTGFSVTDKKYYNLQEGQEKTIGKAVVVFSLAEKPKEWQGISTYMKFLAAIFPL